jgi:trehalose 6-phosphate synthase
LILANRSYLDHDVPPTAGWTPSPASGGLLAAVRPLMAPWDGHSGTTWIGAGRGTFDREFTDGAGYEILATPSGGLRHRRLFFDRATWEAHYASVSNSFFWPLLHIVREPLPLVTDYYPAPAAPTPAAWRGYRAANEQFAAAAMAEGPAGICWVHDYQLALVPRLLREAGFGGRIGFFLHTPFPDIDVAAPFLEGGAGGRFKEFIQGILGADLAGFQSQPDVDRFREAAVRLCGAAPDRDGLRVDGRRVVVAAYPVGLDVDEVALVAADTPLPPAVASLKAVGLPLVVGLERADFTKGIPERLRTLARLYDSGARFAYAGVAAPTREGVPAYTRLGQAIDEAASEARRAAERAGLPFVHLHEAMPWPQVVAMQREADVVFTSSLADGMNLVPLQAAIAQSKRSPGHRATVITGRDAGVSHVLAGFEKDGLVPVDPLDPAAMANTLREALSGHPGCISDRLVDHVFRHDARAWGASFLSDLGAVRC